MDTSMLPSDESNEVSDSSEARETGWVTVAHAPGIEAASILIGRLRIADIPARAWQEGASHAFPTTVGLLGTAHVLVPAKYAEQATQVLSDELEVEDESDEFEMEVEEEEDSEQ